jgi:parallel beta-helix repeat protein
LPLATLNGADKLKKLLVVGIIVIFIGISIPSSSADIINIDISKKDDFALNLLTSNKTLYVGGSEEGNYSKINDAIRNASYGDTIFVYDDSSPYYECVWVDRTINLVGENRDTTVIDGKKNVDVIKVYAENVSISGFTITGSADDIEFAGIKIYKSKNSIYGNIFIENRVGILVRLSSNSNIFHNNIFKNNDFGLWIKNSIDNIVYENSFFSNYWGLSIKGDTNNSVMYNSFIENTYGIDLGSGASNNNISYNTLMSNNHGIQVHGEGNYVHKNYISLSITEGIGIYWISATNNIISNNYISNNTRGIYIEGGISNIFEGNIIIDNIESGIEFEGGDFNKINHNHLESNSIGVYIFGAAFNEIKCNNFIDNDVFLLYFRYQFWGNILGINFWKGNYWDSLNGDIKVIYGRLKWVVYQWYDGYEFHEIVIYRPRINYDWHPASEPYDITTAQGCGIE